MQISDDDRILPRPARRSPATTLLVLLGIIGGVAGSAWYYLQYADAGQRQQLAALQQAVQEVAVPANTAAPEAVAAPEPAPAVAPLPDPVVASEPPLEPLAAAPPLPSLDDSDAGIRQELAALPGWQVRALELLAVDQLLRRFVTFVNNLAVGKIDHKSGPFLPLPGRFAVSPGVPLIMAPDSQARYNLHVDVITALDPQQCAVLYRRFYPLLNAAYAELGEKGNFHALVLRAIDVLDATPDLTQSPVLVPAEKGLYRFAEPQLETLLPAQKQLLRSGWENVTKMKVWLRQLRTALVTVQ